MPIQALRAAVLIAAGFVISGCAKSPESTVESFYVAVAEGNITEAQSYLSAQVIGMIGSQKVASALAQESERAQRCGGIRAVEVQLQGEGEIRSGSATITYRGKCPPKREGVKLVKEEGKWKLGVSK